MKKIFNIFSAVVAIFMVASCSTDWKQESQYPFTNPRTGETPVITFSGESRVQIGKFGDEYVGSFTANLPWTAESLADWIVLTSERTGQGGNDVIPFTFKVSKNASLSPRTGKIRVKITDEAYAYVIVDQQECLPEDLGNPWYIKVGGKGDGSSWADACDLGYALANCATADKLYIAAGTYKPTQTAGGSKEVYKCFLVSQNVWLFGGYPENAQDGDVADPVTNKTILSGANGNYHNLVVAAPADKLYQVHIDGLIMQDSDNTCSSAGSQKLNGQVFYMTYGAAVYVAGTKGEMTNCVVTNNKGAYVPGLWVTPGSNWVADSCSFTKNNNTENFGAAIHNAGTLIVKNSVITDNVCAKGAGPAVYNYDLVNKKAADAFFYNCYIANNTCENNIIGRPGAVYCRENSRTVFANCTVSENTAGNAPVYFYGTSTSTTQGYVISSTITGNTASASGSFGGVVQLSSNVSIYNSVISGNTAAVDGAVTCTAWAAKSADKTSTLKYSASGSSVYGDNTVTGAFDGATMIGSKNIDVYPLIGSTNPAKTGGMTEADLKALDPGYSVALDADLISKDQKGNARNGNVMGAYVGN